MSLERLGAALRSLVTRGTVQRSTVGRRTMLQISGLAGEVVANVELLLPPGMSANLASGNDVAVFQVGGTRDHLVALGGDTVGGKIADLAAGEFGFSCGQQKVIWRASGKLEVAAETEVDVTAPRVKITGDLYVSGDIYDQNGQKGSFGTLRDTYDEHTHPVAGSVTTAPNQQL